MCCVWTFKTILWIESFEKCEKPLHILQDDLQQTASVQRYLNYKLIKNNEITNICLICCNLIKKDFPLYNTQYIDKLPLILIFALASWIDINKYLEFNVSNSLKKIHFKGNHMLKSWSFYCRACWWKSYHDGQVTQSICLNEQSLMNFDDIILLKFYGQYEAIMVFYAKI